MEFGIDVIQQCRQHQVLQEKKNTKKFNKKKSILIKKFQKRGTVISVGCNDFKFKLSECHLVGWVKKEAPLRSHSAVIILSSFPKVPKTEARGQKSQESTLGGPRGAGSRGRGGEEGRTRTKHHPQLCPVPGSAGWGGEKQS